MSDLIKSIMDNEKLGFVDVHGHEFCWGDIPDEYIKTRAPVRELFLRNKRTKWAAGIISWLWPGKKYRYIVDLFNLIEKPVYCQAVDLRKEMKLANTQLMILNMMDLEQSSFGDKPEIPWKTQISSMSDVANRHYGVLMPFVHYDPRRDDALEIVKDALENKGFLGVKMYPALGWNPLPSSNAGKELTLKQIDDLWTFYEYADSKNIPITIHCSRGGAYSDKTMGDEEARLGYTDPVNWEHVLNLYPTLRLNLAHLGQDLQDVEPGLIMYSKNIWAEKILYLCRKFDNVYTDLAYNDQAHDKKLVDTYFKNIWASGEKALKKIMYGSDWPMMRHTWKLEQWVKPFIYKCPAGFWSDIMRDNALRFLFHDLNMPRRIYKAHDKKAGDTPEFLKFHFKRLKRDRKKGEKK